MLSSAATSGVRSPLIFNSNGGLKNADPYEHGE